MDKSGCYSCLLECPGIEYNSPTCKRKIKRLFTKTNGDLLRAMEDQELAKYLSKIFCHGIGENEILSWLKKDIDGT